MKWTISLLSAALLLIFISGCSSHTSNAGSLDSISGTSSSSKTTNISNSASKTVKTPDSSTSVGNTNGDQNAGSLDSVSGTSSSSKTTNISNSASKTVKTPNSSTSTDNTNGDQNAESQSSDVNNKHNVTISNSTEAINYLRHQLNLENNKDISFGEMDGLITDKGGSYYTIGLVDISVQEQGGSGTIGRYKVYQNGTYVLINPNDDSESQ